MRLVLLSILAVTTVAALAQDGDDDDAERAADLDFNVEPERCVRTRSIRRTKVIDNSTIAFYMRDRDLVYVNMLRRTCPELARYERFAYETRAGRLCSSDTITVLVQYAGRLEAGFRCPLGEFHPSDPETVALMIEAEEQGGRASSVTAESVELPPEDDGESAEADE